MSRSAYQGLEETCHHFPTLCGNAEGPLGEEVPGERITEAEVNFHGRVLSPQTLLCNLSVLGFCCIFYSLAYILSH